MPSENAESKKLSLQKTEKLQGKKKSLEFIEDLIKQEKQKDAGFALEEACAEKIIKQLDNIDRYVKTQMEDIESELNILGLNEAEIINYNNKKQIVEERLLEIRASRIESKNKLKKENKDSLLNEREKIKIDIEKINIELSAPQKKYQAYLTELSNWKERRNAIIGNELTIGTIKYLESQLEKIQNKYPIQRRKLIRQRYRKCLEIFKEKLSLREHYSKYYGSVQNYLENHSITGNNKFNISFDVSIAEKDFCVKFLKHINQAKSGNFYGAEDGTSQLNKIVNETNFDSLLSARRFLGNIIDNLEIFDGKPHVIENQLVKGSSLEDIYNLIFSLEYLNPVYSLKWDGKELEQLSPGERGNLLLIFYLILDENDIPLIIDQPEENLDNQTVFKTLVPCVKDAKNRRQIILVTHNPNLAVVCDADQIIYAKMNKASGNEIVYETGSIEDPYINSKILDVLEGTRPAFNLRDDVYQDELSD